ncbi:MAG TPA: flagellar biosynthesis protein FlhF [Bacillota bacterium]|nr:flagellar biosynthesis protein FlhF [Bacillota bacterium]HPT87873.1 flagellar biosynthesis protein FlhF [Bacillota bacterium]
MRVKRYIADSIQEAIARVKNDLGRDAIILHTKPFKEGGFLGLFGRRRVEVIAAVDEKPKPSKKDVAQSAVENKEQNVLSNTAFQPLPLQREPEIKGRIINERPAFQETAASGVSIAMAPSVIPVTSTTPATPVTPVTPVTSVTSTASVEPDLSSIREEIAEMKELIRQVAQKPQASPGVSVYPAESAKSTESESGIRDSLRQWLMDAGLSKELAEYLVAGLPETVDASTPQSVILDYCQQRLISDLMFSEPLKLDNGKPVIAALIGATGVGKTTTIAKLAAHINLFQGRKVGLITIDTYRIAAVEHLKTYGDIMNLPVEVVYAPSDLDQAIQNLSGCDVILIDTAGRSPHNQTMMEELHRFLTNAQISEILLVLSATTQWRDMVAIEDKFSKIAYTHLIFTKLDETSCLGPVVSLAWKVRRPISYLTVGQNVPDDIEVAQPQKLVTELFKGIMHG